MSEGVLKRGLQATIDNYPVINGKVYFATDTCRLFMDIANERLEYSDFVKGLTYAEIINLENPLQKMYMSTDTRQLMAYDFVNEQWISFSGGDIDASKVVSDLHYDENNNIVLVFMDGSEKTITVDPVAEKLNEIEQTLDRYERVIEIIEQEYGLEPEEPETPEEPAEPEEPETPPVEEPSDEEPTEEEPSEEEPEEIPAEEEPKEEEP